MKKIVNTYKSYEHFAGYHAPEFTSNASEFHVALWNLNFEDEVSGDIMPGGNPLMQEFVKVSRQIYKLISRNPQISAVQMSESIGLSTRQVQKYLKRLQELKTIVRVGGRKIGEWKIIDEEYEGFFDRI